MLLAFLASPNPANITLFLAREDYSRQN